MALITGDLVRVQYLCRQGSQIGINRRYYEIGTLTTASVEPGTLAAALSTAIAGKYKALLNNNAEYRGLSLQQQNVVPKPDPTISGEGAGAGTAGGESLPQNIAGIFTVVTGYIGRANRGRSYVPFPSTSDTETDGSNNVIPTAGYMTRLGQLAAYHSLPFSVDIGGGAEAELRPVIVHANGDLGEYCAGATARRKWAQQHRRGSYGQTNTVPF